MVPRELSTPTEAKLQYISLFNKRLSRDQHGGASTQSYSQVSNSQWLITVCLKTHKCELQWPYQSEIGPNINRVCSTLNICWPVIGMYGSSQIMFQTPCIKCWSPFIKCHTPYIKCQNYISCQNILSVWVHLHSRDFLARKRECLYSRREPL